MERQKTKRLKSKSIWKDRNSWDLLLLCVPALIGYILFYYIPMAVAITIPFRDYKFSQGISGSAFVGLKYFKWMFTSEGFLNAARNTAFYSILFMVVGISVNVAVALLLYEVTSTKALKLYQTILTFPKFLSYVVVGYITYAVLSPQNGVLNQIIVFFGGSSIDVYMNTKYWPLILTIVSCWKGIGTGAMMYFASLMGIDTALFEAAEIDGANRWQRMRYISLPHLLPLICIFMILDMGKLFEGSFDLFYLIPRDVTALYETTDVLNTFVYRALQDGNYSSGSAVGLVQSVLGLIMIVATNLIVKKISPDNSLF